MLGDPSALFQSRYQYYQIQVRPLEDGQFYWHVLLRGERVNGGLSESKIKAEQDAMRAAQSDMNRLWA
jgi:dsRNA-specific ribonuclease